MATGASAMLTWPIEASESLALGGVSLTTTNL